MPSRSEIQQWLKQIQSRTFAMAFSVCVHVCVVCVCLWAAAIEKFNRFVSFLCIRVCVSLKSCQCSHSQYFPFNFQHASDLLVATPPTTTQPLLNVTYLIRKLRIKKAFV